MIGILVISRCAAPPLSGCAGLSPHPGDRINRSMLSCRGMVPWLSTHSAPSKWGWQRNWIHRGALRPANPVTCFPSARWWRQPPKGDTPEWYMKYMTPCFSLHIPRFPLRGNASKRQKGVQGRASKWHSIAVLTANRRPPERSPIERFSLPQAAAYKTTL